MLSRPVMSNSTRPHGLSPARLLCPWRFSRQEYWSDLPCPPPGDLTNAGIKTDSPELWHILYYLSHQGSPRILERVAYLFCKMGSITLTPQSFEYLELGLGGLWKTGACYLTDKIQLMKSEWLISQEYENGKTQKGKDLNVIFLLPSIILLI